MTRAAGYDQSEAMRKLGLIIVVEVTPIECVLKTSPASTPPLGYEYR